MISDELVVGLDVGTSSSKAVATTPDGLIVATRTVPHAVDQPRPGWFEQDAAAVWRDQSLDLLGALVADEAVDPRAVRALAVSGMGPCVVPTTAGGSPLRPGILYGIDTRAGEEVEHLERKLGAARILQRGGSALSSQALGPKLLWIRRHEPDTWARTRRWFGPASLLVHALTGEYVLDHHTASQCDPLYDLRAHAWCPDWTAQLLGDLPMPRLAWSDEVAGPLTRAAASRTGLPAGIPVLTGTIDAWAEAHSVGVRRPGDLFAMYGSTMFLIAVTTDGQPDPALWLTAGITRGSTSLAAGMATSGLLVDWVSRLTGRSPDDLGDEAQRVPAGADGLLLLPYFAGERSPLFDPGARGVLAGLQLRHTPGHVLRAAFEGVALGVRHVLESFAAAGGRPADRMVVAGGGAASRLWLQTVADVTGFPQALPEVTIGAAYGNALLAAGATGLVPPDTDWTRIRATIAPDRGLRPLYDDRFRLYRDLYRTTRELVGELSP